MTAAAVADSLGEFRVGEPVWCLARIGQPFEVVAVDDVHDRVSIRTRAGWPTVGQIDIFPETRFMITREQWDQIWYWPDRAGETYLEVYERFVAGHSTGDVVVGIDAGDGLRAAASMMTVDVGRSHAMAFRISRPSTSHAAGSTSTSPI